jgi:23S rRNA pseudouridine1911/1915/1917 synthase
MEHYRIKNKQAINKRLDKFLSEINPSFSRSYFQKLIDQGQVMVNQKLVKPSYKLKLDDSISFSLNIPDEPDPLVPENIPLNVVFENDDVIVINKQPGLVVHPAVGNKGGTLINALLNYLPEIKNNVLGDSQDEKIRPGLVQRLDKDTSGLMMIAKNPRTMIDLSKQIKNRTVVKKYLALCYGWPKEKNGEIISFLGRDPKNRQKIKDVGIKNGRKAILKYQVKDYFFTKSREKVSLLEFDLKTGRTHQIRVQVGQINLAILGDEVYGGKNNLRLSKKLGIKRQLLHSKFLSFRLPNETKKTTITIVPPEDFKNTFKQLIKSD